MNMADKIERVAAGAVLDKLLKYVDKDPQGNLLKLVDVGEKLLGGTFPKHYIDAFRKGISDGDNVYYEMAMNILKDVDRDVIKKMLLAMGLGAGVKGTKAVRKNREKYKCNIPFQILIDPTSACNCKTIVCINSHTYRWNHCIFSTITIINTN